MGCRAHDYYGGCSRATLRRLAAGRLTGSAVGQPMRSSSAVTPGAVGNDERESTHGKATGGSCSFACGGARLVDSDGSGFAGAICEGVWDQRTGAARGY